MSTHPPFEEVETLRRLMKPFTGDYWVAGGWAVDLFLGQRTRDHADVEAAIPRARQAGLLRLPWLVRARFAHEGQFHPWEGAFLSPPVHGIFLDFAGGETVEILLNEFENTDWIYRRNLAVRRNMDGVARGAALPVEIALLYKSKKPRDKDEADFRAALPRLAPPAKTWLRDAIALDHPAHPWLESLAAAENGG